MKHIIYIKLLICTEVLSLLKLHVCKKGVEVSFVLSDQWCARKASLLSCTLVQFHLQVHVSQEWRKAIMLGREHFNLHALYWV